MISKSVHLGDKIEITKKSILDRNETTYQSFVQEIGGNNELVVTSPIVAGKLVPLELDRTYSISIYTERGLYRCEGVVVDRTKEDHLYLATFKLKTAMQKYQRRQYYRLDCLLNFHYKDEEKEIWNEGIIKDISGGGIRFTSRYQFEKELHIECHIQLNFQDETKHLYVPGQIVDSIGTAKDLNLYETRVVFGEMSGETREVIIRCIFDED
ncbi:MAG: flagellar brake protein, partial [Vallitaleaceae bacterium]|nr:flagellar brake protein [Vallitaleaceae bacterium]